MTTVSEENKKQEAQTTPKLALLTESLVKKQTIIVSKPNTSSVPSIIVDGVKKPLTNESNIRFQSELVRKNWKNVLDIAKKNRDMGDSISSSHYHHQNDMFSNEKFNWIFFSIIMSILIMFSIIICFCVYYFMPQFRI
jgi:hypothetical protein